MKLMSLHGLSRDAWDRYSGGGWDYRIVAPGFKYNLTDLAAAIGIHQLARAEQMRLAREERAAWYDASLRDLEFVQCPPSSPLRHHAWHLYAIQLRLDRGRTRNEIVDALRMAGVTCSVHWRPLHLHPYYQERYGYRAEHCPRASAAFDRLMSLPLFPTMSAEELSYVIEALRRACETPASRVTATQSSTA
jgi:perosamine synthetase